MKKEYYRYDENDHKSFFNTNIGYQRINEMNEIQKNLLELIKPKVTDEWTFDHLRYHNFGEDKDLVFVFQRELYPTMTTSTFEERKKIYDEQTSSDVLKFNPPLPPWYKPVKLSQAEIDSVIMPEYKCTDMLRVFYNEIHEGQGEWGYAVNVLFIQIPLSSRRRELRELKKKRGDIDTEISTMEQSVQ